MPELPVEEESDKESYFDTDIPSKEAFYSSPSESHINDNDCQHVKNIWTTLELNTLAEYHEIYLTTDVLIGDVFENFGAVV